jgi:membrane protease YdiL (CAAX protease family)
MHELTSLSNPFIKVLLPIFAICIIVVLAKYKLRLSLQDDLFFSAPKLSQLLFWTILSASWMLLTNYLLGWRGEWNFSSWYNQLFYISVLRVVAVGILGPIAEELLFRGLLFNRLQRAGLKNKWLVVVVLAAAWAAIHVDYTWQVQAVIFVFGLLLGSATLKSKSILVPIVMHVVWNLYAVW